MPNPRKLRAQFGAELTNPAMARRAEPPRPKRLNCWGGWSFASVAQSADRAAGSMRVLGDILAAMRGVRVYISDPKGEAARAATFRELYPNVIAYRPTKQDPYPQEFPCR